MRKLRQLFANDSICVIFSTQESFLKNRVTVLLMCLIRWLNFISAIKFTYNKFIKLY